MDKQLIENSYSAAKNAYQRLGTDTDKAMPITDIREINDTKRLRFLDRKCLNAIKNSKGLSTAWLRARRSCYMMEIACWAAVGSADSELA